MAEGRRLSALMECAGRQGEQEELGRNWFSGDRAAQEHRSEFSLNTARGAAVGQAVSEDRVKGECGDMLKAEAKI